MKAYILTCLLLLLVFQSKGQNSKVISGDTTFWRQLELKNSRGIHLPDLISSSEKFHFRYWKDTQVVDIWTNDEIVFNGLITNYIHSYSDDNSKKKRKPSKIFFNQVQMDSDRAKKVYILIKQIENIPTDKSIKGWSQGFDGVEYCFETSTSSNYSFKTYWTPTVQDSSLTEAKAIEKFVTETDSVLNLHDKYQKFFATLKPGNYIGDGPGVVMKLTPKQIQYFKETKPYRDYLHSIKDTLTHYLRDTLTKIFSHYGEPKCYDEFFLKFSKDNKLLSITTNSKFSDKEDKRDFLNCKEKIMTAFNSIIIDFVHSKVNYQLEMTFNSGGISVFNSGFW